MDTRHHYKEDALKQFLKQSQVFTPTELTVLVLS